MALSKRIKYFIFIVVISLVALTGCSNSTESTNRTNSNTEQNPSSGSISEENEASDVNDQKIGENGEGEGIADFGINDGSEATQAFIPEGFPIPNDRQMIEDETTHIFNDITDVVNVSYLTKTSTKKIYDQYLDYFKDYPEYSVTALSDPMLITAISDKKTLYIEITEVDDSTKVYISISIPKE